MKDYTALDLYRDLFRRMLREKSEETVSNDSADYARILIAELLRSAQHEVWIYCTKFNGDVWSDKDVLDALRAATGNRVVFHVLTRLAPDSGNEAVEILNAAKVDVKTIDRAKADSVPNRNFLVVDGISYRFEIDPEQRRGIACANGVKNAQSLIRAFQNLVAPEAPKDEDAH